MTAAIYARKSTEQNGVADAEKSVTRQIEHATDYAVGKGWTVAEGHIYCDDGISGAEFANRPGFLRLMNALKPTPGFHVLIMSEELHRVLAIPPIEPDIRRDVLIVGHGASFPGTHAKPYSRVLSGSHSDDI